MSDESKRDRPTLTCVGAIPMTHHSSLITRRRLLRTAAALGAGSAAALAGHAQDAPPAAPAGDLVTPEAQAAVDRGLAYLAGRPAQGEDGSYSDPKTGFGNVAITGLAGLALLAGGHHPGRGRFGDVVARAARYVVGRGAAATPPGFLNNADVLYAHDGMYQHGFGALFLAEVCGTLPAAADQRRCREILEKAVELTRKAQNREGAWRYKPVPDQHDVSVTVAQLMALRAARNAGVFVPKSTVDKCVQYIRGCQLDDGGFCYIKGQQSGSSFARSAAAVVGLFSAGVYDDPAVTRGLDYLMRYVPGQKYPVRDVQPQYYYYGQYYAALAMWTAGGAYWARWFPAVRDELVLKSASAPGRVWTDYYGQAYATAMACIVLQLPNNYLPIMQK